MIYALKTTVNQEQAVANLIMAAIKDMDKREHGIKSILVPDELKGYVLIEAAFPDVIEQIVPVSYTHLTLPTTPYV